MKAYLLMLLSLITISAHASDDCSNITSSDQAYVCSFQKKEAASLRLKKEYDLYISDIKKYYHSENNIRDKLLNKVKISQERWLSYMNIMCDIYSFQIDENNKFYAIAVNTCISDMSDKRRLEIANMIDNI